MNAWGMSDAFGASMSGVSMADKVKMVRASLQEPARSAFDRMSTVDQGNLATATYDGLTGKEKARLASLVGLSKTQSVLLGVGCALGSAGLLYFVQSKVKR